MTNFEINEKLTLCKRHLNQCELDDRVFEHCNEIKS